MLDTSTVKSSESQIVSPKIMGKQIQAMMQGEPNANDALVQTLENENGKSIPTLIKLYASYEPPTKLERETGMRESKGEFKERQKRLWKFIDRLQEHEKLGPTTEAELNMPNLREHLDKMLRNKKGAAENLVDKLLQYPGSVKTIVKALRNYRPPSMEDQMTGYRESTDEFVERKARLAGFIEDLRKHSQLGLITKAALKQE